jgi:arylsulfatase
MTRVFDEWYGIPRTTDEAFGLASPRQKRPVLLSNISWKDAKVKKSRELEVYDLDQRRLIDAEITRTNN